MPRKSITIELRLYEELNRVLPQAERKRTILRALPAGTDLGGLIDSLGLDREEVDLGLVNAEPAPFHRILADRDRVSLYPEFESLNIEGLCALRDRPLRRTRFVLEPSLGELARLLKEMGYDCRCPRGASPELLASISLGEKRILLTKNPDMAVRFALDRCFCLASDTPLEQLREVMGRFQLGTSTGS
jgi:hypothetical protein